MARTLDETRHSISVTLAEIQATERQLGMIVRDPADREAFDIICRIERRLLANPAKKSA